MSSIGRIGGVLHDGELCRVHYSRQQLESLDVGFRCVPQSKHRVLIGGWFRTHFWVLHRHSSPSRGNQRVILGRLAYEPIIVFGYVPVPFRHTVSCRMLRSGKVIARVDTHKHIHVAVAINQPVPVRVTAR